MSTQIFEKGFSFNPTNLDELKNAMFNAEEYAEKCRAYYPLPKYKVETKVIGKQWTVIILELDDREATEELKMMKEVEEQVNRTKQNTPEEQENGEKSEKNSESEEER